MLFIVYNQEGEAFETDATVYGDFVLHPALTANGFSHEWSLTPINSKLKAGSYAKRKQAKEAAKRLAALDGANWRGVTPDEIFATQDAKRRACDIVRECGGFV